MKLLKKLLPAVVFLAVVSLAVSLYAGLRQPEINAAPASRAPEPSSASPSPTPSETKSPEPTAPTTLPTAARDGDFVLTKSQDFDKAAELGKFEQVYGPTLTGYNGFFDHANRGPGLYAPNRVLSVQDGLLNYNLHSEHGVPLVAAPTPTGYKGQLYGKYVVRFRADLTPGYRLAFLLWPESDVWQQGEVDFPEADLVPLAKDEEKPGSINGFSHDVTGNPVFNHLRYITRETAQQWHVATIEWTPTRVTFDLDGKTAGSTNPAAIPTHKMRWVLQTQVSSAKGVKPDADVSGNVQVDWFAQYRYAPQN